jgi:hypothetical protein
LSKSFSPTWNASSDILRTVISNAVFDAMRRHMTTNLARFFEHDGP